jgi:hypothetical protein
MRGGTRASGAPGELRTETLPAAPERLRSLTRRAKSWSSLRRASGKRDDVGASLAAFRREAGHHRASVAWQVPLPDLRCSSGAIDSRQAPPTRNSRCASSRAFLPKSAATRRCTDQQLHTHTHTHAAPTSNPHWARALGGAISPRSKSGSFAARSTEDSLIDEGNLFRDVRSTLCWIRAHSLCRFQRAESRSAPRHIRSSRCSSWTGEAHPHAQSTRLGAAATRLLTRSMLVPGKEQKMQQPTPRTRLRSLHSSHAPRARFTISRRSRASTHSRGEMSSSATAAVAVRPREERIRRRSKRCSSQKRVCGARTVSSLVLVLLLIGSFFRLAAAALLHVARTAASQLADDSGTAPTAHGAEEGLPASTLSPP